MSPAAVPSAVDLPETSIAFPPLLLNDMNIPPPTIMQTTPTLAPIYTVGLIVTAMLSLGALVLLLTKGEKRLWKMLFSKSVGRDEIERTDDTRNNPTLRFRRVHDEERGEHTPYATRNYPISKAGSLRVYQTDLHPIAEEDEDLGKEEVAVVEKVYATGMEHPSESTSSLSSLSSSTSFKSEEDIAEADIHSHSIARRVRRWADPMEVLQASKSERVSCSSSASDSLKLGWDLAGEEKDGGLVEVKRAISQNMEMAKGQLVSLVWPTSGLVRDVAVSGGDSSDSSDGGLDSGDSSHSTLSSIPESDVGSLVKA